MKRVKKAVFGAVIMLVLGISTAFVATEVRWTRTFAAPYPAIAARADPATIAQAV